MPTFPNTECHPSITPFYVDVSTNDVTRERGHGHRATSEIRKSPRPERRPIFHEQPTNDSSSRYPPSTATPEAAISSVGRRHTHFLRSWWLEIGACFIFILALLAIIVTLRPHQGKPLPQWPYDISINSLISIYVVLLKATVLFVAAEGIGKSHRTISLLPFSKLESL